MTDNKLVCEQNGLSNPETVIVSSPMSNTTQIASCQDNAGDTTTSEIKSSITKKISHVKAGADGDAADVNCDIDNPDGMVDVCESLTYSLAPLADSSLTLPFCPSPFLAIRFDEHVSLVSVCFKFENILFHSIFVDKTFL